MSIKSEEQYAVVNEKFPRIGLGLEIRWGTDDFEPYISDLLTMDRHNRQGFPTDVYSALQRLLTRHHNLFPDKRKKSKDIWNNF